MGLAGQTSLLCDVCSTITDATVQQAATRFLQVVCAFAMPMYVCEGVHVYCYYMCTLVPYVMYMCMYMCMHLKIPCIKYMCMYRCHLCVRKPYYIHNYVLGYVPKNHYSSSLCVFVCVFIS